MTLLDAWGAGNGRSSSGGETRVIRAIYGPDRLYTEMVARSFEAWRELESTLARPFYQPTGILWMLREAESSYVQSALPICSELGFPIDRLNLGEARRRWPQIDFRDIRAVYFERRGGALSARSACHSLSQALVAAGGEFRIGRATPGRYEGSRLNEVRCRDGSRITGDQFVFACGPWLGPLFPDILGPHLRVSRQEVFYFGTPPGSTRFGPDRLPIWVDFGERVIYGLPDTHGRGFKIGDDTRGPVLDPTTGERSVTPADARRARDYMAMRFPEMAQAPYLEGRVCQYANTPEGHLIADRHPTAENVWLLGGGSGHGFKLSPALGELVASAVPADTPLPEAFSLRKLTAAKAPSTQFER